ncbi:hypothetical protein NMG60_11017879 [Bertholletia excelsa]
MAASSSSRGLVCFGKGLVNQIRAGGSGDQLHSPSLALRRAVHASAYDKNVDEQLRPTVVPDHIIGPQPDKYWAPHPQTGVFGPDKAHNPAVGAGFRPANGGEDSVLDQKAFFRSSEGLEKPETYP